MLIFHNKILNAIKKRLAVFLGDELEEIFVLFFGKKCSRCKERKNIKEFGKTSRNSDGLSSICRKCKSEVDKEYRPKRNALRRERRKNDICFRLKENFSRNVRRYIKGDKNNIPVLSCLPYSMKELKEHLESCFEPWMNWDNYGSWEKDRDTWQVDHIIPQSKLPYDSVEHENFKRCWDLSNLQPLKSSENFKKGDK